MQEDVSLVVSRECKNSSFVFHVYHAFCMSPVSVRIAPKATYAPASLLPPPPPPPPLRHYWSSLFSPTATHWNHFHEVHINVCFSPASSCISSFCSPATCPAHVSAVTVSGEVWATYAVKFCITRFLLEIRIFSLSLHLQSL
jgi:hypothetical protein